MEKKDKLYIGVFGRCNIGKSSLINRLAGQEVSIVSPEAGTTTDSVKKSMEINGLGAVVLVDTAGLDDISSIGEQRIEKAKQSLKLVDLAIIGFHKEFSDIEKEMIALCKKSDIDFILVHTKSDLHSLDNGLKQDLEQEYKKRIIIIDKNQDVELKSLSLEIKELVAKNPNNNKGILDGLVAKKSLILLVTPIDSAAPEGRLILPQVQLIRSCLDSDSVALVVKETELEESLKLLKNKPDLVITDSQVFDYVSKVLDSDIPLTSFSILLARQKGMFSDYLKGTPELDNLKDGDRVLMLENCTHQPTCQDIGRVKLPNMIRKYTKKDLVFDVASGFSEFPCPITDYSLVIQCGGCVATRKQLENRLKPIIEQGVAVSNYGLCIAYINNIFSRSCAIFSKNE